MKTRESIFLGMAAAALCLGCTKENDAPEARQTVTITASIPETAPATKVSFSELEDGSALALAWEADDALTVIGSTTETFRIQPGFEAHAATFDGNAVSGSSFHIIYPASLSSVEAALARSYAGQVQDGNGSMAHLRYDAMLYGVDDYRDIAFTPAWAAAHQGTLYQNAVLKFHLQLPADIETVESISLSADDAIFYSTNAETPKVDELTLTLENVTPENRIVTAYLMLSCQSVEIAEGQTLTVTVSGGGETWSKSFTPGAKRLEGGCRHTIKLSGSGWTDEALFAGGTGIESDPYIITKAKHIDNMRKVLDTQNKAMMWFEMGDDVDMSAYTSWSPFATSSSYVKQITFDGKGHKIKNFTCGSVGMSGLFGTLGGEVSNIEFVDAVLAPNRNVSGLVAGYTKNARIENITGNVTITAQGNNKVGGLVGYFDSSSSLTMKGCHMDVSITADTDAHDQTGGMTGGLVGYANASGSVLTVEDCSVSGSLVSSSKVGGIVGYATDAEVYIAGCSVSATVTGTAKQATGGVIGYWKGAEDMGMISDTHTSGDVQNDAGDANNVCVGGIVGQVWVYASLQGCSSSGKIGSVNKKDCNAGGLIGKAQDKTRIADCWSTSQVNAGNGAAGGLVGRIAHAGSLVMDASITGSYHSMGDVTLNYGKSGLGGIIGGIEGTSGTFQLKDCWTSGNVKSSWDARVSRVGGLVGAVTTTGITVSIASSWSTTTVQAGHCVGGLVGAVPGTNVTIKDCIAWNTKVTSNNNSTTESEYKSAGMVVGYANPGLTVGENYRPASTGNIFTDKMGGTVYEHASVNPLTDASGNAQPTATAVSPYHGSGTDDSLVETARSLGWDETIWDLDQDVPTLKTQASSGEPAPSPVLLKVMSFNVRVASKDVGTANDWDLRKAGIPPMIAAEKPVVFGVQEADAAQMAWLQANVSGYGAYGVGRDDGASAGEFMSIFYDASRVSLLENGTFWLSETPSQPSYGWDAACRRTATWAILELKSEGKRFFYVNTHLDHQGETAQAEGLKLIVQKIAKLNPQAYPAVLTGDFNIKPDHTALSVLRGTLKDTREIAPVSDHLNTYNAWGGTGKIIDYIWCTGFSRIHSYHTVTDAYAGITYLSDHYPVTAVLRF